MKTRFLIIIALIFFSFSSAPLALALTPAQQGVTDAFTNCMQVAGNDVTQQQDCQNTYLTAINMLNGTGNSTQTQSGGNTTGSATTLINPLQGNCSSNTNCLESFLQSILQFIVRIGAIVVILMLVFVGYKFVEAQGAPGKIEEARTMLLWTVIGALILLGAQAISLGIQATVTAISAGT